jgi:Domain of unknown function (DUF5063)
VRGPQEITEAAEKFGTVVARYCETIDRAQFLSRNEFLRPLYSLSPELILEAMRLPVVIYEDSEAEDPEEETHFRAIEQDAQISHDKWEQLYRSLKTKLADWDHYHFVFDPLTDSEAIVGSLADDLADIYRDLKEGITLSSVRDYPARDIVFDWRCLFESHWGKHAINALTVLHALSAQRAEEPTC